jgi:methylated-DNA-[protein]-cysteine S-methyltransferase
MSTTKKKYWTTMETPVGELFIAGRDGKITDVLFSRPREGFPGPMWEKSDKPFREIKKQLGEYFRRERKKFDLKLAPEGTLFQLATWRQLRRIPYSETISYGEQANRMGNPRAARAVGAANGKNPISIIVPCHRVIGANGRLTGFGGGLGKKKKLLDLEGAKGFRI